MRDLFLKPLRLCWLHRHVVNKDADLTDVPPLAAGHHYFMDSEQTKFFPMGEVARLVGRHPRTVRAAILAGKISPDAEMIQQNRRNVSLFSEKYLDQVRCLLTDPEPVLDSDVEEHVHV